MNFDQNIILIILAAVVGISRLVARIAEQSRKQAQRKAQPQAPKRASPPIVVTRPKTDEEKVREFLEALGQAPSTPTPPKVQPRTDIPPRPLAPIQPPASMRPFSFPKEASWKELRRRVVRQQPGAPASKEATLVAAPAAEGNQPGAWIQEEQVEAAAAKFTAATRAQEAVATAAATWREALRSPDSVRSAIVFREILGPPRAFAEMGLG